MAKSIQNNLTKLILALVVCVLLLVSVIFFLPKRQLLQTSTTVLPSPIAMEIDSVNDGVYTNHKYGYRFDYPTDKFKQTFSDPEGGGWSYLISENSYIDLNASQLNDNFYDAYKRLYEAGQGSSLQIKHTNATNVRSENQNGVRLVIAQVETVPDSETESVSGYSAVWLRDPDNSITLNMYDFTVKRTDDFKRLFDQIVDSFEFIK